MKLKLFITLVGLFLFFLFLVFAPLNQARALDYAGLALSPPTFELSANPGDSLENTIRVENLTETPMRVSVQKRNFTALGEEGAVNLTEEEDTFSLASWITVLPSEAEISPKGIMTFTFRTAVPLNAEPGGHFGSIIFRIGGQSNLQQSGAVVAQELGALVLVRIAGKTSEKATLESFVPKKRLWERGPVEFEIRIKNEGNVHLKPTGVITITNIFGKKVASFNPEPKNVLPGAIRKSTATWNQKFLFGKYTASLALNYGTQGQILTGSTTFIGFPYKGGGLILLGLALLVFLLYRARKRISLALKVLFGKYK
jgi:hypothetical protein